DTERVYKQIDFPPLTEEQEKEIEKLKSMKDEEIDTEDIPEVDFSAASFFYAVKVPKQKIYTSISVDNLEWLKSKGKGYQQRLDNVIRWARMNNCPM
ncbi:MAG: BrnA antitoxin family protein, partial [Bullifex sp.]